MEHGEIELYEVIKGTATCQHQWVDADCDSPKTCSVCGETEGDALGHKYENGICTGCGEADPDAPVTQTRYKKTSELKAGKQ